MRKRFPTSQRGIATAWAGGLSIALMLTCASTALAQSAEDEEDLPWDTKIVRGLFKDLGLRRDGEPGIEYRERAPLVVPPSRTLPPPRAESSVVRNPAWPKDPDEAKRRVETAKKKKIITGSDAIEADGRPLSRSELERGRVPAGTTSTTAPASPEESGRPMRPSQLGTSTKSLFSGMFSSFSEKGEVGEFTGEPPRVELTSPPPGYQTPSPSQPYGLAPKGKRTEPTKFEDRVSGVAR